MFTSAHEQIDFTVPPFDLEVLGEGSNQRSQAGTFQMEVRRIVAGGYILPGGDGRWHRRLGVEGRRYKPDGSLGSPRVYAVVRPGQLPPDLWAAIRDYVPAELHSGGGA